MFNFTAGCRELKCVVFAHMEICPYGSLIRILKRIYSQSSHIHMNIFIFYHFPNRSQIKQFLLYILTFMCIFQSVKHIFIYEVDK